MAQLITATWHQHLGYGLMTKDKTRPGTFKVKSKGGGDLMVYACEGFTIKVNRIGAVLDLHILLRVSPFVLPFLVFFSNNHYLCRFSELYYLFM